MQLLAEKRKKELEEKRWREEDRERQRKEADMLRSKDLVIVEGINQRKENRGMAAEDEYCRQLRLAEKKEEMLEEARGRNNSNLRTLIELDLVSKERSLQEEIDRKESKSLTFVMWLVLCVIPSFNL